MTEEKRYTLEVTEFEFELLLKAICEASCSYYEKSEKSVRETTTEKLKEKAKALDSLADSLLKRTSSQR